MTGAGIPRSRTLAAEEAVWRVAHALDYYMQSAMMRVLREESIERRGDASVNTYTIEGRTLGRGLALLLAACDDGVDHRDVLRLLRSTNFRGGIDAAYRGDPDNTTNLGASK